jgi:hypothetical protein
VANGVYEELGRLAHRQRRRWEGGFTLTTTALVHEAYLKLAGQRRLPTESRAHFLAIASKAMRHILCNYARDRRRPRHVSSQRQADWAFARAWLLREMQLTLAGEE